jgi:arylsulfatase A-like enzyme
MKAQTRREFLKRVGFAAASIPAPAILTGCAGAARIVKPAKNRPNVVLVITDDQGYGDLSCHGNKVLQTPNLDRLHSQSIRLNNFHVDPTCSPTRSALMTGRYSSRTGVWHTIMGRSLLRRDEITMANIFSASGYRTAIFGKWHLGDNYPFRPQDRGFQEVLVHCGGGVGQTPDFWGNDYFDDTYFHNGKPQKYTGYCTDVFFDNAMEFIEANKTRTFFVYLATNAPHSPFNVSEKYSKPFEDKGEPTDRARFYGMITNIDENIGRLMQHLKRLGLEENTIVIFMTDNGSSTGDFNAGMRGKKGAVYDGGHRVPFFIRWPVGELAGGRDISTLTAHIDVLPTLIELCGLNKPQGIQFDGTSLLPLLAGDTGKWPDRTLFVHSQRVDEPIKWRNIAVMTERWRLINGTELYDIKADTGQTTNIAGKNSEVVQNLRKSYERWWTDVSRRFDEYCEIIIGSDVENPVRLTCHDWHGPVAPSDQNVIRQGPAINGFWVVEVDRDDTYRFTLRRWPIEESAPINAAAVGGKGVTVTKARLKIADVDVTKPIPKDAHGVAFEVFLKPGKTRLQTWFTDDGGSSRGAYFVYVERL